MAANRGFGFLDRASEREHLDRLLAKVREGQSAALVLSGEAGIGKTALLHYAARQASGFRVAQIAGVEAEMELPFASTHQLCAPMLGQLDALPQPQRRALNVAFGLASGEVPDRFLVALAVLSLLSAVAEERPFLCLVDDAQFLDAASVQVLAFVARRLDAESVALIFAVREPAEMRAFQDLPQLPVGGLDEHDARELLAAAVPGPLDARVRDRVVAETRGNPLALVELPRGMSAAELGGGYDVPLVVDLPRRLEDNYLRQIAQLPAATRRLLVLAAADPVGDAVLVWRAAHRLGIGRGALEPAQEADLLQIGGEVRFRHPLVRSAVYRAASPEERQEVHAALAEALDVQVDPDRRAWHRAGAAAGPDEDVASELESSADRARARAGLAAAAAFLRRSVALTQDRDRLVDRALAAAEADMHAGAFDAARGMLAIAEAEALDALGRARVTLLRGQIAAAQGLNSDVAPLLLEAARQLEPLDLDLARETYVNAFGAAAWGGAASADDLLAVGRAVRALPAPAGTPRAVDTLLDGIALLITEGHAAAAPTLLRAARALASDDVPVAEAIRWGWFATAASNSVWDDDGLRAVSGRFLELARDAGALVQLPAHLTALSTAAARAGDFATAASLVGEVDAITEATGIRVAPNAETLVLALRGREAEAEALFAAVSARAREFRQGNTVTYTRWAASVLYNGLGRYEDAYEPAAAASSTPGFWCPAMWALPELVEAASRTGALDVAREAVERLAETTRPGGTSFGLGVDARSRALVSEGDHAEDLYRQAIDHLSRTGLRVDLGRSHLLYGEWLRREGRRVDAREQLRMAHRMFTEMGIEGFAERTRRELLATGASVRRSRPETRDDLTPQERQIAWLARDGLSNSEIAARLFLSRRTVEWHLRHVFAKLGIHSRRQLVRVLSASDTEPVSA
jgi:DNA-binding CsgD family transcriptional regulator